MTEQYRTGKRRYRHEKDKIILQVEWKLLHTYWAAGMVDSEWVTVWRDATLEDISEEIATT